MSQYEAYPSTYLNTYQMSDYGSKNQSSSIQVFTAPVRNTMRTPSPSPSELQALNESGGVGLKSLFNPKTAFTKARLGTTIAAIIIIGLIIAFAIFHDQIVKALEPAANWMHNLPAGWLIPVAILIVMSFPPLFGHDLVNVIVGFAWGLGEGFGIVVLGTYLGEAASFFVFRQFCTARSEKLQKKSIKYGCFARVARDGSFKILIISRLSIIPPHLLTAVYSTCGIAFWKFSLAVIIALPKQFAGVLIGYVLAQSEGNDRRSKIISVVVTIATIVMSVYAGRYMNKQIDLIKPEVIYQRRKARQAKLAEIDSGDGNYSFSEAPVIERGQA